MDIAEVAKIVASVGLTGALGIAVYTLWKKLNETEAKVEAMVERYHTTLTQITDAVNGLAEDLKKANDE